MRKIFIDCGSHDGCSVRKFKDLYDKHNEFEYFCFEINSLLKPFYKDIKDEINLQFKGVSTEYGTVPFLRMGMTGGSTIDKAKARTLYEKQFARKDCMLFDFHEIAKCGELKNLLTEVIDISHWIRQNFSKDDYIVLKMDIEGAEYAILDHLIKDECVHFLNELKIEFHRGKVSRYIDRLKTKNKDLHIDYKWDAMHPPYLLNKKSEEYYYTYEKAKSKYREDFSYEEKIKCCEKFVMNLKNENKKQVFFQKFKMFLNDSCLIDDWRSFIRKIAKEDEDLGKL
jgi:FkbM family methyltransferase